MTTIDPPVPPPFTGKDFAARMRRVVESAVEKGLAGVIVTPGPDLVWLTGYQPTAITERLTMLVLSPDDEPTLLLPVLERPDAEAAEGAGSVSLVDWEDGTDPYEVAGPLLRPDGEFGISDSAWAMHVLGLQRALPKSSYRAITESLPRSPLHRCWRAQSARKRRQTAPGRAGRPASARRHRPASQTSR